MFYLQHGFPENFASWSKAILYDISGRMQYIGFANPSLYPGKFVAKAGVTETSTGAWAVALLTYDGASTRIASHSWVRDGAGKIKVNSPFDDPGSLTFT